MHLFRCEMWGFGATPRQRAAFREWALVGSNHRPLPCQGERGRFHAAQSVTARANAQRFTGLAAAGVSSLHTRAAAGSGSRAQSGHSARAL